MFLTVGPKVESDRPHKENQSPIERQAVKSLQPAPIDEANKENILDEKMPEPIIPGSFIQVRLPALPVEDDFINVRTTQDLNADVSINSRQDNNYGKYFQD